MRGSRGQRIGWRRWMYGGAACLIALAASASMAQSAPANDLMWLRVEITDGDADQPRVKVNLPLSLIEVVIDSVDTREFLINIEQEHPSLDIRKLWREVRRMKEQDFLTVESDHELVRVWKDDDFFRINVRKADEEDEDRSRVELTIPLDVMDYLLEGGRGREFSFQGLVERLRGHLPLTLARIQDDGHLVKIWIEED